MKGTRVMKQAGHRRGPATPLASPALPLAYSSLYCTGNIVNQPLAEATDGAAGVGKDAYNGAGTSTLTVVGALCLRAPQRHHVRQMRQH